MRCPFFLWVTFGSESLTFCTRKLKSLFQVGISNKCTRDLVLQAYKSYFGGLELFMVFMCSALLASKSGKINTNSFPKVHLPKYWASARLVWIDRQIYFLGSMNDNPSVFKDDQLFILMEQGNGGTALEDYCFTTARSALSIFVQVRFTLWYVLALGKIIFE